MDKRYKFGLVTSLTLLRFIFVGFFVYWASNDHWLYILIFLPVVFLTDMADGYLARKWKVVSNFGTAMDPLADKLLTLTILYLVLNYFDFSLLYLIPCIVVLGFDLWIISVWVQVAKKEHVASNPTYLGKVKTAILMSTLVVIVAGIAATGVAVIGVTLEFIGLVLLYSSLVITLFTFRQYHAEYKRNLERINKQAKTRKVSRE